MENALCYDSDRVKVEVAMQKKTYKSGRNTKTKGFK